MARFITIHRINGSDKDREILKQIINVDVIARIDECKEDSIGPTKIYTSEPRNGYENYNKGFGYWGFNEFYVTETIDELEKIIKYSY